MGHNCRLTPEEPFPEDLTLLDDTALEVLNSRLHRQRDAEYLSADPQLETEIRLEEVSAELNRRDAPSEHLDRFSARN